jgi:hypothetical protein
VKPPLELSHGVSLFIEMLQELAQRLDGVVGIDGGIPGYNVHVDEALRVEKWTICLVWLACTLACL